VNVVLATGLGLVQCNLRRVGLVFCLPILGLIIVAAIVVVIVPMLMPYAAIFRFGDSPARVQAAVSLP
jgi:hypothetical protein